MSGLSRILHGLPHLLARQAMQPAPPSPKQGPTPMSETNTTPAAAPWTTQLKTVGEQLLADLETRAEPIAQAALDELLSKLPFGDVLDPLANAVLQKLGDLIAAKLDAS
jgi:hypothetical protein